jgi:hypothetical protein
LDLKAASCQLTGGFFYVSFFFDASTINISAIDIATTDTSAMHTSALLVKNCPKISLKAIDKSERA